MTSAVALWLIVHATIFCTARGNAPPQFQPDSSMLDLVLREDTLSGAQVYQVKANDPDGDHVYYSISGDHLSIDRDSGVVTLVRRVDRETERSVEVILTLTDDAIGDVPANVVSVRRLIPVVDANDNPPIFNDIDDDNGVYSFIVQESAEVGSTVFSKINVTDRDFGANGEISLMCDVKETPYGCSRFDVRGVYLSGGAFVGLITVRAKLDYEKQTFYDLNILALDGGQPRRTASARIHISVEDVQDQPPVFISTPYSAVLRENTPPGSRILDIIARDGDVGKPRDLKLRLLKDYDGYLVLDQGTKGDGGVFNATLRTGSNILDFEDNSLFDASGIANIYVMAKEMLENGMESAESAMAEIVIVAKDEDDSSPVFDRSSYSATVPEDTSAGTSVPSLSMLINDPDQSSLSSSYSLSLHSTDSAASKEDSAVFDIVPHQGSGQTIAQIVVVDTKRIDYECVACRRHELFVLATPLSSLTQASKAGVVLEVTDINDNPPIIERSQYQFNVLENVTRGEPIGQVNASDVDGAVFGRVKYHLRGFDTDKFHIDVNSGVLSVGPCVEANCIDYEQQSSYAVQVVATDGGNRSSTADVFIDILDVNDNRPVFERQNYQRHLGKNDTEFHPAYFIRASDKDTGNNGVIKYAISDGDPDAQFAIDPSSGQLMVKRPAQPNRHSVSGKYELLIQAQDQGQPTLTSIVRATVVVGLEVNRPPKFSRSVYSARIDERAVVGTRVVQVSAVDPDDPANTLAYFIVRGGEDNFDITNNGTIYIAKDGNIDLEQGGRKEYNMTVSAVEQASFGQAAEVSVVVIVQDINDSPPKFQPAVYAAYISEKAEIGEHVVKLTATDRDSNADLRFSIVTSISARDESGVAITIEDTDISEWFTVNASSGVISVNSSLDRLQATVVTLKAKVTDAAAEHNTPQVDYCEITVYIRVDNDNTPVFDPPWTASHPVIDLEVDEELPPGATIFTLKARDPVSGEAVTDFSEIAGSDIQDWFMVDSHVGEIMTNRRMDFEAMDEKVLSLRVRAVSAQRTSQATIRVTVGDINDNSPIFSQNEYEAELSEDAAYSQSVINITAEDRDSQKGFGSITYSLSEMNGLFQIDALSGEVKLSANTDVSRLDRETLAVHHLIVTAHDNPQNGDEPLHVTAKLTVSLIDVNDNRPEFDQPLYQAVIPETAQQGSHVATVTANDPDSGPNGQVGYQLADNPQDMFLLHAQSGQLSLARDLAGMGQRNPYRLTVRAQDNGSTPLFSEVTVQVYIGDVNSNDGRLRFIRPSRGDNVTVQENMPAGTVIYHARAVDSTGVSSASGNLIYSLIDAAVHQHDKHFMIDSSSGEIKLLQPLDREKAGTHKVMLVVTYAKNPAYQASRSLEILVEDLDDNVAEFTRSELAPARIVFVREEQPVGSTVMVLAASDGDQGDNGHIHYNIVGGNAEKRFALSNVNGSVARLTVAARIDYENSKSYLLTIQCHNPTRSYTRASSYDSKDKSMVQLQIYVTDINDNAPVFAETNITSGVKVTTPVRSLLASLRATDADSDGSPIHYRLDEITFSRRLKSRSSLNLAAPQAFVIDSHTGKLWTNENMAQYVGGRFDVTVAAYSGNATNLTSRAFVQLYVIKDQDSMEFVFNRPLDEVVQDLEQFRARTEMSLPVPVSLNIFDLDVYRSQQAPSHHSLTRSCFQMSSDEYVYTPDEVRQILNPSANDDLRLAFEDFQVEEVKPCRVAAAISQHPASTIGSLTLAAGAVVLAGSVTVLLLLACRYNRSQHPLGEVSGQHRGRILEAERDTSERAKTPGRFSVMSNASKTWSRSGTHSRAHAVPLASRPGDVVLPDWSGYLPHQ